LPQIVDADDSYYDMPKIGDRGHVSVDPVVERLIQRCMEKDPNARPASVAHLALALPGGDLPAAAIAACREFPEKIRTLIPARDALLQNEPRSG
jgi:hypothetical protein